MVDRGGGVLVSTSMSLSGNGGNPSLCLSRGMDVGSSLTGGVIMAKPEGPSTPPVPMNLFATWEVDRCSPSCVPRYVHVVSTEELHSIGHSRERFPGTSQRLNFLHNSTAHPLLYFLPIFI